MQHGIFPKDELSKLALVAEQADQFGILAQIKLSQLICATNQYFQLGKILDAFKARYTGAEAADLRNR